MLFKNGQKLCDFKEEYFPSINYIWINFLKIITLFALQKLEEKKSAENIANFIFCVCAFNEVIRQ